MTKCGFNPHDNFKWECTPACKKTKVRCEDWGSLLESVVGTDATPPRVLRREAVEAIRRKLQAGG